MKARSRFALLGRRHALAALFLLPLGWGCAGTHSASNKSAATQTAAVSNGMYAVVGEPVDSPRAEVGQNQRQLRYDPRMADSQSTDPVQYVTVQTGDFVPLVLATAAEHRKQDDGRILIGVSLAAPYVQKLADFTRTNLGQRVALVLDGEVMSTHKVRTIIDGGRMQITRCDEHSCQRILSKLVDGYPAGKAP